MLSIFILIALVVSMAGSITCIGIANLMADFLKRDGRAAPSAPLFLHNRFGFSPDFVEIFSSSHRQYNNRLISNCINIARPLMVLSLILFPACFLLA